jgi:threonine synthase
MNMSEKFHLDCSECGRSIAGFPDWFRAGQRCPACGSGRADVRYRNSLSELRERLSHSGKATAGLWHYFDFLPLNDRKNIVTGGEGIVPIDRWEFLEDFARLKLRAGRR